MAHEKSGLLAHPLHSCEVRLRLGTTTRRNVWIGGGAASLRDHEATVSELSMHQATAHKLQAGNRCIAPHALSSWKKQPAEAFLGEVGSPWFTLLGGLRRWSARLSLGLVRKNQVSECELRIPEGRQGGSLLVYGNLGFGVLEPVRRTPKSTLEDMMPAKQGPSCMKCVRSF